jgi:hypothetical protein
MFKISCIPSTQHSSFCTTSLITTRFDLSGLSSGVTQLSNSGIYTGIFYNLVKLTSCLFVSWECGVVSSAYVPTIFKADVSLVAEVWLVSKRPHAELCDARQEAPTDDVASMLVWNTQVRQVKRKALVSRESIWSRYIRTMFEEGPHSITVASLAINTWLQHEALRK